MVKERNVVSNLKYTQAVVDEQKHKQKSNSTIKYTFQHNVLLVTVDKTLVLKKHTKVSILCVF